MKLHELAGRAGSLKVRKRIGRGIGSGKGKTGGRGGKGQTARSGVRIKGFEGGQMPLHRRLPKRGFKNIFKTDYAVVNLDRIATLAERSPGQTIDHDFLVNAGLVSRSDLVKVLGTGDLKAAVTVRAHKFSKSAQEKIERAGGKAIVVGEAPAKA